MTKHRSICEIAGVEVDDGVTFSPELAQANPIREEDHYSGVRVTMPAAVGKARVKLALDINFGDPVTPGAVRTDYPLLLPAEKFHLLTYPVETVLAEKIVTALARGETNTRDRDWADVWRLTGTHKIEGGGMIEAIRRTGVYRGVELGALSAELGALVEPRSARYCLWRRQQGADAGGYPTEFADVVNDLVAFADPLLSGHITHQQWDPHARHWAGL